MQPLATNKNAIAAIRVSTTKQGTDGDSPEAQIERYASSRGITIKKFFVFLESASKEQQPMQEAINYCKNPKNNIELFIIKSIDRFTRGGSYSYDHLKTQLDACKVSLVDIYGVISGQEVNTLDHLGFEYKWSRYSPSKKSEILEAERAKDELRDILSRMVGAEIRYTQIGYWMRQPPYGFISEKVETKHGKRCLLKPHPTESKYLIKMFELSAKGTLHDEDIIETINKLGFRTRVRYRRDKSDRSKINSKQGGDSLTVKAMHKLLRNPIYTGINAEKWTGEKPIRCAFEGLVSIDTFNKANKGKKIISESEDGDIQIYTKRPPEHLVNKGARNPDFPYRRFILCPTCSNPLTGSASRGKSGKYYPAYHCSNHGHSFRIPKQELEARVASFISNVTVSQKHIDLVIEAVATEWKLRSHSQVQELESLDNRIAELQADIEATIAKIRVLNSPKVIALMEQDLLKIEQQIEKLTAEKASKEAAKPGDVSRILARVKYFLEHLDELLVKQIDPIKKARFFAAIFDKAPTYEDLKLGTPKTFLFTGVNPLFQLLTNDKSLMVTSRRIELRLPG